MKNKMLYPLEREEKAIYMGQICACTLKRTSWKSSFVQLGIATCALSTCI